MKIVHPLKNSSNYGTKMKTTQWKKQSSKCRKLQVPFSSLCLWIYGGG
jgi:hypothetical protein